MVAGVVKACWIICTNPVASVPNRQTVIDGLKAAELVITQDAFLDTETNVYADVLLPGALWAEAEGTMINSERNITLMQQAVAPPGEAMADWRIIAEVAKAMGFSEGFNFASAEEVFEEIKGFTTPKPAGICAVSATRACGRAAAMAHATAARQQPQPAALPQRWPQPAAPSRRQRRAPGASVCHRQRQSAVSRPPSPGARRNTLRRLPPSCSTPAGCSTNGTPSPKPARSKPSTNSTPAPLSKLTRKMPRLWVLTIKTQCRSAPGGHGRFASGDHRAGSAGQLFCPIHWNDLFGDNLCINAVTSDYVDPISQQPG